MTDSKALFALADADDAEGLAAALKGVPETFRIRNEGGETLFLYCLYRGKAKCLELLGSRGELTLHEAAAAGGGTARVEACLRAAPWSIQTLSGDGWTALHLAAFLGRDATLEKLLELGADAGQWGRAFDSNLALHAACAGRRLGKAAFVKLLAATGDPDIAQKSGYTALMIAAANGCDDAVDALLAAGADKTRKLPDGKTASDFARERGHAALAEKLA